MRFLVYILLLLILFFSGCTFDTNSDPQDELLSILEEENENLQNEITRISNLVEELQKSKEELINQNTTIEFDDLELEYLLFRNSCQNMIQRANNKLNRNIFEDYFEVSDEIDSLSRTCEEQYKTNFRNLDIYDNSIYSNYNDIVRRLENREDDLRRINSDNCIDDAEDLKFELRDLIEFDRNFDLAFYVREFEGIKEFCGSRVSINEDEYDELIDLIEELINSQRDTSNGEEIDIDSLKEEIKKELEEERLQREEERRLENLQEEFDEYFNTCNGYIESLEDNYNLSNLSLRDISTIYGFIQRWCISPYSENFRELESYNNFYNDIVSLKVDSLLNQESQMVDELKDYCIPEIESLIGDMKEVENNEEFEFVQNRYSELLDNEGCGNLRLGDRENNWNELTNLFFIELNEAWNRINNQVDGEFIEICELFNNREEYDYLFDSYFPYSDNVRDEVSQLTEIEDLRGYSLQSRYGGSVFFTLSKLGSWNFIFNVAVEVDAQTGELIKYEDLTSQNGNDERLNDIWWIPENRLQNEC